jgi:hypothetical protein
VCKRRAEEKTSSFGAQDHVGLQGGREGNESIDDLGDNCSVREQWQQIAEENSGLRKIRDLADALLEIDHNTTVAIIAEQRLRS